MSWVQTKATGSGELRFAIVIEGWPETWVTDKSVTYAPDGQTVRVGLSCEGLAIRDRVIMHQARCDQDGITFKIRPTHFRQLGASSWDDQATASFSKRVQPIAVASNYLEWGDTAFPSLEGGGELEPDTVYWIGSEAILMDSAWPNIAERGYYSSIEQTHHIPTEATDAPLYVWSAPPTMEGRRVYLYVWGQGDDPAAAGTCIWRGLVRRPPKLARDGVTWEIQCGGIVEIMRQRLAGDIKTMRPVGIYHHSMCSVRLRIGFGGTDGDPVMLVGWKPDETAMLSWINAAIAAELANTGADAFVDSLLLTRDVDDNLRLELRAGSSGQDVFAMELSSPIIGGTLTFADLWTNASTGAKVDGVTTMLSTSTTYYCNLQRPHFEFFDPNKRSTAQLTQPLEAVAPLGQAYTIMRKWPNFMGANAFVLRGERWQTPDATDKANNPAWRIYVDADATGVEAVAIPNTDKPSGVYEVTATGSNSNGFYIEVEPYFRPGAWPEFGNADEGFMGFLDNTIEIKARRNYGGASRVFDFVALVKQLALTHGNLGDTPFVTSEDLDAWGPGTGVTLTDISVRAYIFYGPVELDRMLEEELKLIGYTMRIELDGRVGIEPLPPLTSTTPVDVAIDEESIITPAGSYGAWPAWEPQRDGRITTVKIQQEYDALTDSWVDEPVTVINGIAAAIAKNSNKALSEIKPYSRRSRRSNAQVAMRLAIDGDEVWDVGLRHLRLFAHDYDVVTVAVPFTMFDVLCCDIVSVTHPNIPDGNGRRGLSARRGVVIERRWPLDPSADNHGLLTIMLASDSQVGYAPSALITAQADQGGDVWNLTCGIANALNVAWSTNGDGLCLEHFADGDYIRLVPVDDSTPANEVTGTISGTPNAAAGTCAVALDSTWVPGAGEWVVEFQEDTTGSLATAAQRKYAYVADSTLMLADDTFARVFQ